MAGAVTSLRHPAARCAAWLPLGLGMALFVAAPGRAAPETLAAGAYIVDMGQALQTVGNGIKPYGLVYDLIANHKIPVKWVINPGKTKDGVDFTTSGKDYRGGPFVIPAEFATEAAPVVALWQGKGVVVDGPTTSDITVDVYDTLTSFPRSVLDLQNGDIAAGYLVNAEIPGSYYREDSPANLNSCDDLFAMPHADPTWATHQNLKPFNQQGGFIWAACHAVSVLEQVTNPVNPTDDLHFLSADGLVDFGDHDKGTPPYDYFEPTDSIMQFMGSLDDATLNGSEQIYIPEAAGWRGTTRLGVRDLDHPESPEAAVVAYGRGHGVSSHGLVMYEGGHNHSKAAAPANVAAQRAFLNLLLQAGIERRPQIITTVPSSIDSLETVVVSASVTGGSPGYSYQWISSCGGSFADPTAPTTTFTAPLSDANLDCILRVVANDTCNRLNFQPEPVLVIGKPELQLTKADSQDPVPTNGSFSYTLSVTNQGGDADSVTVTDPLPADVAFVSVSPGAPTCSYDGGAHQVSCDLGTLAAGASQDITIDVTAPAAPTTLSNSASVTSPDGDLDPSNNADTESTRILPATDLEVVSKTVSPAVIGIGDDATYTLSVRNNGPLDATNVVLSDPLPAGLSYVSASGEGWSCSFVPASSEVRCVRPLLVSGATAPDITVQVTATASGMLGNTATVSSADLADTDPSNDSASTTLDVQAAADLSIWKTTSKTDAADGNTLTFTLEIRNDGPDTATNVVVTDTLPYSNDKNVASGFRDFYDIRKYDFTGPLGTTVSGDGVTRTVTVDGLTITVSYDPVTTANPDQSAPVPEPAHGTPVDIFWTVSPGLAPGETLTLVFEAKKEGDGQALNTASVTADEPDPDPTNNTDTISLEKNVKEADLALLKTAPASVPGSSAFSYTLSVKNNGPTTIDKGTSPNFNFVTVTDTLPEGVSYVGFAQLATATPIPPDTGVDIKKGTWACSFDAPSREVTCTYTLDQGDNFDNGRNAYDVRVDVTAPATPGTVTNTAEVSYAIAGLIDNTHDNDVSSAETQILPANTDLSISKIVSNGTPTFEDTVDFTVTVTNEGPVDATGVQISDLLPAGLTYQSHTASTGSYDAGTGAWVVGDLANGASATLTLTVQVDAVGTLSNTASLTDLDQNDTNAANDEASAGVDVAGADLAITKGVDDPTPPLGANVVFTLTLSNNGPDDTTAVVEVTDQLPAGLTYVSHVASQGTYTPGTGLWDVGLVPNGGPDATLEITARVDVTDPLVNTGTITLAELPDPDPSNNSASVAVNGQAADLRIEKTVDDDRPLPPLPQLVVFTLTVTNDGPTPATGVEVTDLLPAGLMYVSHVLGDATDSYDSGTGVWVLGDVAVGDANAQTLEITADVTELGSIDNVATVTALDQLDPDLTNNEDTQRLLSGGEADLFIVKSVDEPAPDVGDLVTFTIYLDNFGPDQATNVEVTDLLPAALAYQSHVASAGSYDPATGVWSLASIDAGTQVTLEITAEVTAIGLHVNTATITAVEQGDPDPIPTESSASVDVRGEADLSLVKTVDDPNPGAGGTATFTLTLANAGPDPSTSIEVTDLLPVDLAYVSHVASSGSYAPGTGIWDVPGLGVLGTATLDITVTVGTDAEVTNVAEVTDAYEKDPDSFPGNGIPSEDDQDGLTLNAGVPVSGTVYEDANHNGSRDGSESGTGETLFAKLVPASAPGGPAEEVVAVDPATGAYAFPAVAPGDWRIVIDVGADPSDVTPDLPAGWIGTQEPDGVRELTVAINPVARQDFGLFHGSRVDGTVFADDGAGGGAAGNGVRDGAEAGISGVALEATAPGCGGPCDAATTGADGAYTLWIPFAADAEVVSVVESNPAGFSSSGGDPGTTGGSYDLATDTTSFTHTAGTTYTGVDFGDVAGHAFQPDHQRTALPGTVVFYPHVFTAGADGSVRFDASAVPSPALPGWAHSIYADADCSGTLDAGESLLQPTDATPVSGGGTVCIVVRESVPPGAPMSAQDLITVTATFSGSGGGSATLTVTDLTLVGQPTGSGLALEKSVDKTTAQPGEELSYTITFRNDSSQPLTDLVVNDATPAWTAYVGGSATCPAVLPSALTACAVSAPADGTAGSLQWTFTGSLDPGQSADVVYRVRIE